MVKLEVSDKVGGNFGRNPYFKKGYYPAKLVHAEIRKDKEGNDYIGTYGKQLVMKFAVYKADENGTPTTPLRVKSQIDNGAEVEQDVVLPKFTYCEYKNADTGEFRSALTPNSAITKIFLNLGWKFDATKELDIDNFIGEWCELNIDDYEATDKDGTKYRASGIKDVNKYEGHPIEKNKVEAKSSPKSFEDMSEEEIEVIDSVDEIV